MLPHPVGIVYLINRDSIYFGYYIDTFFNGSHNESNFTSLRSEENLI